MAQVAGYDIEPLETSATQQMNGYDIEPIDAAAPSPKKKPTVTIPEYGQSQETTDAYAAQSPTRAGVEGALAGLGEYAPALGKVGSYKNPSPLDTAQSSDYAGKIPYLTEGVRMGAGLARDITEAVGAQAIGIPLPATLMAQQAHANAYTERLKRGRREGDSYLGNLGRGTGLMPSDGEGDYFSEPRRMARTASVITAGAFGKLGQNLTARGLNRLGQAIYGGGTGVAQTALQNAGEGQNPADNIGGAGLIGALGAHLGSRSVPEGSPEVLAQRGVELPQSPEFNPEYVQRSQIERDPVTGRRMRTPVMVERMPLEQAVGGYSGAEPFDTRLADQNINLTQAASEGGLSPDVAGLGLYGNGQGYPGEQPNLLGMANPYRPSFPPQFDPLGGYGLQGGTEGLPPNLDWTPKPEFDPLGGSSIGHALPEPTAPYNGLGGALPSRLELGQSGKPVVTRGNYPDLEAAAATQRTAKPKSKQKGVSSNVKAEQASPEIGLQAIGQSPIEPTSGLSPNGPIDAAEQSQGVLTSPVETQPQEVTPIDETALPQATENKTNETPAVDSGVFAPPELLNTKQINFPRSGTHNLSELVSNDEIFRKHPDLKNVKVILSEEMPIGEGEYDPGSKTIMVHNRDYFGPLVHEMTHAVQHAEGREIGSNIVNQNAPLSDPANAYKQYLNNPSEQEASKNQSVAEKNEAMRLGLIKNESPPTQSDMPEGIVPAGEMKGIKGNVVKLYNSEKTGQTFAVREGETLPDVIERTAKEQAAQPPEDFNPSLGMGTFDPATFKAGAKIIGNKVGRLLFDQPAGNEENTKNPPVVGPAYQARIDKNTPPEIRQAVESVMAGKKKPIAAGKGVETERKTSMAGHFNLAHQVPENVVMQLDNDYTGKGILHKTIVQPFEKGSEGVHQNDRAALRSLKSAVEKSGRSWGSDELLRASRVAFGDKEATVVPLKLSSGEMKATPAEWISAAAHLGDEQTADQVLRGRQVNWDRDKLATPFKIDAKDIRTINQWVKDNGWEPVLDAMKKHIEGNRERLFSVVKNLRGDILKPYKGYWSRRINRAQQIDESNLPDAKAVIDRKLENMNFLKSREENANATILFGDAFQEYMKHTHDASMVMNMAEPVAKATAFLSHPALAQAIERHHGAGMLDYLKTYLKGAIGGTPEARTGFEKFQNALTKNFSRSALPLNPSPMLKQIGGMLKLTAEIPIKHWLAGLKSATSPQTYKDMTEASATLWDRHEGNFAHLASPMMGEAGPLLGEMSAKDAMARLGRGAARGDAKQVYGSALQLVDKIKAMNYFDSTVSRVAWAARKSQVEEEHPAWGAQQKKDWLVETVNRDISRTQNTGDSIHMSGFARKNIKNPYARALLLFSSDNNKNFNMLQRAANLPKKEAAKAVGAVALNTVWSSLINTARYAGIPLAAKLLFGGPDDEDSGKQKRDTAAQSMGWNIANNVAGSVYGGSTAVRTLEAMAKKSKGADMNTAPEEVMNQLLGGLAQVGTAIGQDGEFKSGPHKGESKATVNAMRGLEQMTLGGSGVAGMPIPPAYLIGKKAYQAAQFRK